MKAILIDARLLMAIGNGRCTVEEIVREVEVNPRTFNDDVHRHLGCEMYERVQMAGVRHDMMFVDEEGWIKSGPQTAVRTPWYPGELAGNILIARSGKTDVSITVEEVRALVLSRQIRILVPQTLQ